MGARGTEDPLCQNEGKRLIMKENQLILGHCEEILADITRFPDESIDLIVTSPPYSEQRNKSYGGVAVEDYVEWFTDISSQLFRVLKPTGSCIINIKEHVVNGERSTYVLELILALKRQGWKWIEEYCWYKKTAFPGKWPNRFRDSFERCLHFTKARKFYMDQEAVKVPIGNWAQKRFKSMSEEDFIRHASENNSHLARNVSNWLDKQTVFPHNVLVFENEHFIPPTNVLEISPVTNNQNHSACFPLELPSWFIRLLSRKGDIVLDPFSGVGTTAIAAILLNRKYIGIEKEKKYIEIAEERINNLMPTLDM